MPIVALPRDDGRDDELERWDSMLPDGTINPGEMTSFNHHALGAVADRLHRRVAGLASAAPGWSELRIAPVPGGGLTSASAAHASRYGRAEAAWRIDGDRFDLDVTVPTGVQATVALRTAVPSRGSAPDGIRLP